jgi:hypothetical protein
MKSGGKNDMSDSLSQLIENLFAGSETLPSLLSALSRLEKISLDSAPVDAKILPFFGRGGQNGFEVDFLSHEKFFVGLAPLLKSGFAISVYKANSLHRRWFVFSDMTGPAQLTDTEPDVLVLDSLEMAPQHPIKSILMDTLFYEYSRAEQGECNVERSSFIEKYLRTVEQRESPFENFHLSTLKSKVMSIELLPTLTWKERQVIFSKMAGVRKQILLTKARLWMWPLWLVIALRLLEFIPSITIRFSLRPWNNFGGIFRLCTIDVVVWFFRTVRNNIGYSIALAIYGPFTFYFITQPLNPKAMWAVAEVRNAYLYVVKDLGSVLSMPREISRIGTGNAASSELQNHPQMPLPTSKNFGLASWQERMSGFKGLQIAFEKNMVFAARMGRIEQIESQLLFPLTVRAAWSENHLYLSALQRALQSAKVEQSERKTIFLHKEILRCKRAELYIWSKLHRFLGDHYFIVMDAFRDHTYHNRYLGEALHLFVEMSRNISGALEGKLDRSDFELAQKLASIFGKSRPEQSDPILARIAAQVPSLSNPQFLSDFAYRTPLLRQWEILFLLQNRAQEASNYGRMAYTESVRISLFALQTFVSAKRIELERFLLAQSEKDSRFDSESLSNALLENGYHLMFADLASIAPELRRKLPEDTEYQQRIEILVDLRDYLNDREQMWKTSQHGNNN